MHPIFHSDIAARIAQLYGDLSPGYRLLADFLLANPAQSAALSNVELAENAKVSPATASRFAKVLGYSGFNEFRKAQVEALSTGMSIGPAVKLDRERRSDATAGDLMRAGLRDDLTNLTLTMESLSDEACEAAVSAILGARRIFCYGGGLSNVVMGLLTYGLEPFCGGNIHQIQASHGMSASLRKLAYLDGQDLFITAAFPRYSVETMEITQIMRDQGVQILAITDRPSSPLASLAGLTLYASSSRALLPNSSAAAVAMIEGLVMAVANRRAGMPGIRLAEATRYFPEIRKLARGED